MVAVGVRLINMYRAMKKLMIGILGLSLAVACNSGVSNPEEADANADVTFENISVQQALEMKNSGEVVIIDVRSQDEFSSGHIEGALNIDVNSPGFEEKISDLNKTDRYVIYCHSGRRSAKSADILVNTGFVSVYNVKGGISEWKGNGYDIVLE
jgi:rhodanese-related sulfurtransferase